MTAAVVALCNAALARLGEGTIASLDDATDLAASCKAVAGDVIAAKLASYPWRWASTKARLALLVETPLSGWTRAHALPAELTALHGLYPDSATRTPVAEYARFGRRIYSHQVDLWADYQQDVDPSLWPAPFRLAVIAALTAELAVPVTGSASMAAAWMQRAEGTPSEGGTGGLIGQARRLDAVQQPPQQVRDWPLIAARFGGTR